LPNDVIEFYDATVPAGAPVASAQLFGEDLNRKVFAFPFEKQGDYRIWAVLDRWSMVAAVLEDLATRLQCPTRAYPSEVNLRQYRVSLHESFETAVAEYQSISVDPNVMGGAPCIQGTRIPVYMVLDAIEHHGEVEAALRSYPRLTMQQVKDAIGFAKLVVECPIDDETSSAS
jgi:uncharacterized protein (DUF433 family)